METIMICKIDMGTLFQDFFIKTKDENGEEKVQNVYIKLNEIPEFIANYKGNAKIFLSGANKTFLQKIERDTKKKYNVINKKFFYI